MVESKSPKVREVTRFELLQELAELTDKQIPFALELSVKSIKLIAEKDVVIVPESRLYKDCRNNAQRRLAMRELMVLLHKSPHLLWLGDVTFEGRVAMSELDFDCMLSTLDRMIEEPGLGFRQAYAKTAN